MREAPRDLGLADARRSHHEDVLRQDLRGDLGLEALAAHAVSQGDGDSAFGGSLADHVTVELGDDLAGRERVLAGGQLCRRVLQGRRRKGDDHQSVSTSIWSLV